MKKVLIGFVDPQKESKLAVCNMDDGTYSYYKKQKLDHLQAVSVIKGLIQDYEVDYIFIDAPLREALMTTIGTYLDIDGLNLNIESGKIESMNKTYIE